MTRAACSSLFRALNLVPSGARDFEEGSGKGCCLSCSHELVRAAPELRFSEGVLLHRPRQYVASNYDSDYESERS